MNEENEVKTTDEYVLDNDCPTCGASLKYNPNTKSWLCESCRVNYTLEELKKHKNASSAENNKDVIHEEGTLTIYKCNNCGAEIVADETTSATFCVYCRSTAILKSKLSGEFKPDYIIPFAIDKRKPKNEFSKLSKGRIFTPKYFTDPSNIEKIRGIYIPFWLYDINVSGSMDFSAKIVNSWRVGNIQYTETSSYDVFRTVIMDFFKVPVDGSTRFENDIMNSIEPFIYADMVEYNHAYLSGFLAEKYNVTSDNAYVDANKRSLSSAHDEIYSTVKKYTSKTVKKDTLASKLIDKKYVLLPVYMVNVKYGNKTYIFAMNGQTGKFIGNIPLDKKKVFFFAVILFLICFMICFLLSYLVYKVGN